MFDHLLESSRWDDSNKWSNTGFGEEIGILEIKVCALSAALILYTVSHLWDDFLADLSANIVKVGVYSIRTRLLQPRQHVFLLVVYWGIEAEVPRKVFTFFCSPTNPYNPLGPQQQGNLLNINPLNAG